MTELTDLQVKSLQNEIGVLRTLLEEAEYRIHQLELRDRQIQVIQKHLERAAQDLLSASKVEKKEQQRKLP